MRVGGTHHTGSRCRGLALLSATMVALSGCGVGSPPQPDSEQEARHNLATVPLANVVQPLHDAAASMNIVTHISRSGIDDTESRVNTSVFVPKGSPPEGGFPIVALAPRATGTTPDCAPSSSPDLLGLAPTIEALLKAGYVAAVPDYQGLGRLSRDTEDDAEEGGENYYPYLDSTTAGYNIVDAVQAAHLAVPQTSASFVAMGVGEGGQAAWASNELADNYSYELELMGSVSISPVSDINGLADAAQNGTLTDDQKVAFARILAALNAAYPDSIVLDDYRRGSAEKQWNALLGCQSAPTAQQVAAQIPPQDLRPANDNAVATLRGYLQKTTLPQGPARAPMLVVYSGADPISPAAWTEQALDRACDLGDTITVRQVSQPQPDSPETLAWIGDRFKSATAQNDCEGR